MNNELMNIGQNEMTLGETITEHKETFCTWQPTTKSDRAKKYNAINNPSTKVGDIVNKEIELSHIYMEKVQLTDEKTGEIHDAIRTILIDSDGVGYITHSNNIVRSVRAIFDAYGMPDTWGEPITVIVRQLTFGQNHAYTLEIIG